MYHAWTRIFRFACGRNDSGHLRHSHHMAVYHILLLQHTEKYVSGLSDDLDHYFNHHADLVCDCPAKSISKTQTNSCITQKAHIFKKDVRSSIYYDRNCIQLFNSRSVPCCNSSGERQAYPSTICGNADGFCGVS